VVWRETVSGITKPCFWYKKVLNLYSKWVGRAADGWAQWYSVFNSHHS
jgi:hypothetical protein